MANLLVIFPFVGTPGTPQSEVREIVVARHSTKGTNTLVISHSNMGQTQH